MRQFYNLQTSDGGGVADLYVDGEIVTDAAWSEGGVEARKFRRALEQCGDVTVHINSPGGDVFAAAEMYSALMEHRARGHRIAVRVTGIAASAASVIAMAGDEVLMSPVAYMMIHDPWTYAVGNAREMEHQAEVLREIGEGIIAAYQRKTGKERDELVSMLAAETYMNAQRCIDEGFADGILYEDAPRTPSPASEMRACFYGRNAVLALLRTRHPAKTANETADEDQRRARARAYAAATMAAQNEEGERL